MAFYDNLRLKCSGQSLTLPGPMPVVYEFPISGLKFGATRINLQGQACKKLHGPCASNHRGSTGIRHGSTEVCAASTCNVQEGLSAVAFGVIDDSNFVARASVNLNPLSRHLLARQSKTRNTTANELDVSVLCTETNSVLCSGCSGRTFGLSLRQPNNLHECGRHLPSKFAIHCDIIVLTP